MIIQTVETFPLFYPLNAPYGDANGYKAYRSNYLFRIRTRSGVDGWGECVDWLPTLEKGMQDRVIPYLLGKEATKRSELVSAIKKWHPRIAAGVSMALLEITAKQAGLFIGDFWGGQRHKQVPVYASFQSYTPRPDWMDHSLFLVEQAVNEGFGRIKVKIGGKPFQEDWQHISALVSRLEDAVQVALDANQSYDLATAIRWNRLFEKSGDWLWFEEPMPLDGVDAYRNLRKRCLVPIAGGENLAGPEKFLPFLQRGALDLIQPDVMHIGGVGSYWEGLQLARHFGIRVSPHNFDGILSRWYELIAQSCLPPWSKMKGESIEPVEWQYVENPLAEFLPVQPVNGMVRVSEGIGIAIEPDQKVLERYRWDGRSYS